MTEQIVIDFAEGVVSGIRKNIQDINATGMGAPYTTGGTAGDIGYRFNGDKLLIFGPKWVWTLEYGRRPGKRPPMQPILEWIDQKGINTQLPKKSLAFLISRKIGEEGSLLYRKGIQSGILTQFTDPKYIQENLTRRLMDFMIHTTREQILQAA